MSAFYGRCYIIQLYTLSTWKWRFLEPYTMQLLEDLHKINGLTLCNMQYQNYIRANYAVCICGQKVIAGSVIVIHVFQYIFATGKMAVIYPNPCIL